MVSRRGFPDAPSIDSFRERLVGAASRLGRRLSEAEVRSLATHYRLLREWGRKMNLTGLKDEDAILGRHFLEPLAAADLLEGEGSLVDLGSGNGFPAIPLGVLHPGVRLILVESSQKKSAFLWAVLREIGLRGSRVETRRVERAEDIADLVPCKYLTARAVRIHKLLRDEHVTLIAAGGRALLFVAPEEAAALRARPLPHLRVSETRPLPGGHRSRLVVLEPAA